MFEDAFNKAMEEYEKDCEVSQSNEPKEAISVEDDVEPLEMDFGEDDCASGSSGEWSNVEDPRDIIYFDEEEDLALEDEGVHPSVMIPLSKYFPISFYHHDVVMVHRSLGGFCYMFDHGRWFGRENGRLVVDPKVRADELLLNTVVSDSVSKSFAKTTFLKGIYDLAPYFLDLGDAIVSDVDSCKKKCLNFSNVLGNHLLDPQLLAGFDISPAVSDLKFMPPLVIPPTEIPNPVYATSETCVDGVQRMTEAPNPNDMKAPHLVSITTIKGVRRPEVQKGNRTEKILFSNPWKGGSVRLCRSDGMQIVCDPKHAAYYSRIQVPYQPVTSKHEVLRKWEDWRGNAYPLKDREKFRLKREEEVKDLITHVATFGKGRKEKVVWVLPKILVYAKKPTRRRKAQKIRPSRK